MLLDWRDHPRLPRSGYFSRRGEPITAALIHNTGGDTDILQDNDYHRFTARWDEDPDVHASHIAYHYWVPFDPAAFLARHGMGSPTPPPATVVVWCNHLWERSWHGNAANDAAIGIAAQVDGETRPFSQAQETAIRYILDEHLPGQGVVIPRSSTWGHGECPEIYGGGPAWDNNTICPGRYGMEAVRRLRDG